MSVEDDASDFRDGRGERSSFEKKKKKELTLYENLYLGNSLLVL